MRELKIVQVPTLDKKFVRAAIYAEPNRSYEKYGLFLNGRSEWIEKYHHFYEDLNLPEDTALITMDHRGQGASAGKQSYISSYLKYAQDLLAVRTYFMSDKQPEWMIAHSMGSLISLYSQVHDFVNCKKFFLLSPLLGIPKKPVPAPYSKWISAGLCQIGLGKMSTGSGKSTKDDFEQNPYTSDRHRFEAITSSEYRLPPPTFGWVNASLEAIDIVFEPTNLERITGKVFILLPGQDPVVDRDGTLSFKVELENYSEAKVALKPFEEGRHELLSESHRIYSRAVEYINKNLSL